MYVPCCTLGCASKALPVRARDCMLIPPLMAKLCVVCGLCCPGDATGVATAAKILMQALLHQYGCIIYINQCVTRTAATVVDGTRSEGSTGVDAPGFEAGSALSYVLSCVTRLVYNINHVMWPPCALVGPCGGQRSMRNLEWSTGWRDKALRRADWFMLHAFQQYVTGIMHIIFTF